MKLVYTYIRSPMRFLMCKQYGNSIFYLTIVPFPALHRRSHPGLGVGPIDL